MVKAIHSWKPIAKTPTGRPKIRWDNDVKKDKQRLKVPDWKIFVQDRRRWKEVVEKAKTLHEGLLSRTKKYNRSLWYIWNNILLHQSCVLEGTYRSSKWSDTVLRYWKTKFCIKQTSETTGKIALWNEARHLMNSLHSHFWTHSGNTHAPLR